MFDEVIRALLVNHSCLLKLKCSMSTFNIKSKVEVHQNRIESSYGKQWYMVVSCYNEIAGSEVKLVFVS